MGSSGEQGTIRRRAQATAIALATAFCIGALATPGASAAPPTILATSFSDVTTEGVSLEAEINPQGKAVLYRFEYGPADCASNPCTSVPSPEEGEIAAGSSPVPVKFMLTGLTPKTTYHFRVVAKNGAAEEAVGKDKLFVTFMPSPLFEPCPNELFRSGNPSPGIEYSSAKLPDCRAFEQATPLDKDGGDATGTVPFVKAALDGNAISYVSSAGVPGGVGAQDIPSFLASRGEGNWSTRGLLPAGDQGQSARVLGWTPDFSEVFTKATLLGEPSQTELLATPSEGPPVKVVDYTPGLEPSFLATTEDGSLLFESPLKLTPGAVANHPNVYLWQRPSEELVLAGVLNDGKAPAKGALGGPYDWIHGTNSATLSLGGGTREYYTQEEHAISADGKAVYFTAAATGQLYMRRNPSAEQSKLDEAGNCAEAAKACTIRVSASEKTNGKEKDGTEVGGPRPAAFQAASADGSVVYFTSSEELTDNANTGPEPTEPPPPATISRSNLEGKEIEHSFLEDARGSGIAVDATHIYWADPEAGAIGRAELDGKDPKPAFITGLPTGIEDLALDSAYLYWADPARGTIGRAKIDGSEAPEDDFITGASNPHGVAVDGTYVYWTNPGNEKSGEAHSVGRALLDGSEADQEFIKLTEIGRTVPERIAIDASHVYLTVRGDYILRFGLDGSKQYNPNSCSVEGCIGESSTNGREDITLDGSHVYWSSEGAPSSASRISRADLALSEASVEDNFITGPSVEHAQSLAVDASHIYWANDPPLASKPGNDLYRFDAATEELEDLTPDATDTNGAEVQGVVGVSEDGSAIYFAANGDLDGAGEASTGNCQGKLGSMSGSCSLYRWQEGEAKPSFVARLDASGGESLTDAANWAATPAGVFPNGRFQKTARLSGDGSTLLFRSRRQLSAYESEGTAELYRFRVGEGLACVSCDPTLAPPAGTPRLGSVSPVEITPLPPAPVASRNLSADGKRVFFETPDPLMVADSNGQGGCPVVGALQKYPTCLDVYEWEAQGTGSCTAKEAIAEGGCLYLLSTGKGSEPALLADASASGGDAFIFSRARLAGADKDELFDVYDARAEGGLAAQNQPPSPPPCESVEACYSAPAPQPSFQSPGSAGFLGPGNPRPKRHPAKHRRGHKGKGRQKREHRRAHAKRRATR